MNNMDETDKKPKSVLTLPDDVWSKYAVELTLIDKLYGGVPKNPDLIANWIKSQNKNLDEEAVKVYAAKEGETLPITEEDAPRDERMWTGFRQASGKLFIPSQYIKAMLKEARSMMPEKISRQGMQHGLFVKPDIIYVGNAAEGYDEFVGHVMTMMGPRSILKRMDYINKPTIKVQIWVVGNKISRDEIARMLAVGQEIGLGASRSQGFGKFTVTKFEKLSAAGIEHEVKEKKLKKA
jgi:hypothetical protein